MNTPVTTATVELLREIKLFQVLTDSELQQLLSAGENRESEAYSNVVIEGEASWGLYLILSGVVGVFKSSQISGTTYDIGQLKEGSFFGEMSLIDQNPRSATVRALTDCRLFYVSKEAFNQFLDGSPELRIRFYQSCINHLVHRLRELNDHYVISQYQLWKSALKLGDSEAA